MRFSAICCLVVCLFCTPVLAQTDAEKYFDQGYDLYVEEDYLSAIESYTKAINLNSEKAEFFYHRGVSYSMIQNDVKAVADFKKAIALKKGYYEAYFELGYSYYLIAKPEESIDNYNLAIQYNDTYGEAYLNRGTVYFDTDDLDNACADWVKAYSLGVGIAESLIKEYCK